MASDSCLEIPEGCGSGFMSQPVPMLRLAAAPSAKQNKTSVPALRAASRTWSPRSASKETLSLSTFGAPTSYRGVSTPRCYSSPLEGPGKQVDAAVSPPGSR